MQINNKDKQTIRKNMWNNENTSSQNFQKQQIIEKEKTEQTSG